MANLDTARSPGEDIDRLDTIVHYICAFANRRSPMDTDKLNRILLYSDMCSTLCYGVSITCAVYHKRQHGIVPDGIANAVNRLLHYKRILEEMNLSHGIFRQKFFAIKEPDSCLISSKDKSIIQTVAMIVDSRQNVASCLVSAYNYIWISAKVGDEVLLPSCLDTCAGAQGHSSLTQT